MGSISTRIDTDFSSRPQAFGASLPVEPVEVEVDDDPTVLDPEFGASVIEDEDPVEVEVDDEPLPEDTLGATESGILTSWVATEEPKEDKKGKGGKKKKN